MFLGVAACAFAAAAIRFRKRSFFLIAVLAAVAVVPTGSKSGLVLLVTMPLIGVLVPLLVRGPGRIWIPPLLAIAFPVFLMFKHVLNERIPETFVNDSASSLGTRGVIWETAGTLFVENPFLGLGFGGWGEYFYWASSGALGRTFPPHNIFIAAWSDMGVAGAIVLAVFVGAVLVAHVRLTAQTPKRESFAWGFGLAAFLWLFIHGMADAVTFYGDLRTILIPALLLGLLIAEPHRRDAPTPEGKPSHLPAMTSI
nr:O-antigen ligase family protein [Arthrobacter sp. zg-Y769]